MVISSVSEGGANVISEARCRCAVLASRMDGNVGLLGADIPATFGRRYAGPRPLLHQLERDQRFVARLARLWRVVHPCSAPREVARGASAWRVAARVSHELIWMADPLRSCCRDVNARLLRAEQRSRWFILAFAGACVLGSIYGFAQGAWPFGLVEAIWAVVRYGAGG